MASIGRVALSALGAAQETTLAFANLNFDFAIIKMDAPLEFRQVGNRLSKRRKNIAEVGDFHSTARKLGAMFADVLPQVPNLTKVYGVRASQIVSNPDLNPEGPGHYGAFAAHIGLDATSIWAAATSGRGAIEVHLLACILARHWSAAQATSIWAELVAARKKQLEAVLNADQFHMSHLMTAQIDVGLTQLSEWDASARAWLRAADKAHFKQQKQLMLIIDNLNKVVSTTNSLYDDVFQVWCSALQFMESIVSGTALSGDKPEVYIGLSSWHLYPNLFVLGKEPKEVLFEDTLIPDGATISLGMESLSQKLGHGITWTMPLSHVRYYGRPQIASNTIALHSLQVPFDRIIQVAFGSAIESWGADSIDLAQTCHFFTSLADAMDAESQQLRKANLDTHSRDLRRFSVLANCARNFLAAQTQERHDMKLYIDLGRGRYKSFLNSYQAQFRVMAPYFGLNRLHTLLSCFTIEQQIFLLRKLYFERNSGLNLVDAFVVYVDHDKLTGDRWVVFVPILHKRRWILFDNGGYGAFGETSGHSADSARVNRARVISTQCNEPCVELALGPFHHTNDAIVTGSSMFSLISDSDKQLASLDLRYIDEAQADIPLLPGDYSCAWQTFDLFFYVPVSETDRVQNFRLSPSPQFISEAIQYKSNGKVSKVGASQDDADPTELLSKTEAAMEKLEKPDGDKKSSHEGVLQADDITASLALSFHAYLSKYGLDSTVRQSLDCLGQASELYANMPSATVSLSSAEQPLHEAKWTYYEEVRGTWLACVAYFDAGLDLEPREFSDVMAISYRDSIYVVDELLGFPQSDRDMMGHNSRRMLVTRLSGNIGKPGFAMMRSPQQLDVADGLAQEQWRLVNHAQFDGKIEDNFRDISLHLALTGAEEPLSKLSRGNRFVEALYVEAALSVLYRGEWVADIDVLEVYGVDQDEADMATHLDANADALHRAEAYRKHNHAHTNQVAEMIGAQLGHPLLALRFVASQCEHDEAVRRDPRIANITSIDNWFELVNPPANTAIVRARANWSARLALFSMIKQLGRDVLILGNQLCWECIRELAAQFNYDLCTLIILM